MEDPEPGSFAWFAKSANHSLLETLIPDPETAQHAPNHKSRQVKSGHYVELPPTPLAEPYLVSFSPAMARELGLSDEACTGQQFVKFFSGDQQAAPEFHSWCTPYALSIMGKEMTEQCPFRNGNGYGDGRAISVAEVFTTHGQRWELQLKGAGPTPFCRGADGRAVLRSSVREFLAQEAMHSLGVSTTRSLSLVASGSDRVARQWYSEDRSAVDLPDIDDPRFAHLPLEMRKMLLAQLMQQNGNPDTVIEEICAITCRVAPSFLRVGQIELFGRRARRGEHPEQLEAIVNYTLDREFPGAVPADAPLEDRVLCLLNESATRIQRMTADWLRVGFCQGNFNSDNCLVAGRTMDYGPFGFVEKYRPDFALWVGSGDHFAFINQPNAGFANFQSLAKAVSYLLDEQGVEKVKSIIEEYPENAQRVVNDVWRRKLGFSEWGPEQEEVWRELHRLMQLSSPDFTILFRELSGLPEITDPGSAMRALESAFYSKPSDTERASWTAWVEHWIQLQHDDGMAAAERGAMMRAASPKYVPREWILVEVYKAAIAGDFAAVREAQQLFSHPYEEQPEMEARFYQKCPEELLNKGGIGHMT